MTPIPVTVIVPNYNHAKYLRARMDSILNQTFQDFEVIILDDCSTDNSRKIIDSYRSHPKVSHVVYNKTNSGSPFVQWNKGVSLARGSLIWIAESDDYSKLNFLEETVAKMKAHPSVGLVYTQSLELDEITGSEYTSFQDSPRFKHSFKTSYFETGRREVADKLVHENTIPNASGVLFRKSVYDWVGGADASMKLCGDWFLWVKILMASDVYFIAEPLNIFRLTSSSVRSRYSKVQTFHERVKILRWMGIHGIKGVREKELILLKNLFNSFKLYQLNKPVHMIISDPAMSNRYFKLIPAFLFSIADRVSGKISRIQNKLIP
ncbi:MAG: glycosyltransferase family 2 protein [Bacteroidota bacterium]|nr:glycosyltransferase family 2 protein [Bacteroidota bacterium]